MDRDAGGPGVFHSTSNAVLDHTDGRLYVVSTPIGNLADLTFRARDILQTVTLIVAEDTRHSRTLLDHYEIRTPASAYHEHNEARETPRLVARLESGESIALISDAGTPLLSDPGARLVQGCVAAGIRVVPVPGASALLSALVGAGLAADRFSFYGFLDRKGESRGSALDELVNSRITTVIYESPNRVMRTLSDLAERGAGDRQIVMARELTKRFEEFRRGTVAELAESIDEETLKGEVVLVLEGAPERSVSEETLVARVNELSAQGVARREIVARLTEEFGVPRNLAYRLAHR